MAFDKVAHMGRRHIGSFNLFDRTLFVFPLDRLNLLCEQLDCRFGNAEQKYGDGALRVLAPFVRIGDQIIPKRRWLHLANSVHPMLPTLICA